VKRAEIWTVAGGAEHVGQPRLAVVLQDDAFDATASITICPFTSHKVSAPLLRLTIGPSSENGLRASSDLMIDKITTVSKGRLQRRVGRLSTEDVVLLNRAVLVFLGLAGSSSAGRSLD
jgi:mRNA interferase MazF